MDGVTNPRGRRTTRLNSRRQVTIPAEALRESGLQAGDPLTVRVEGRRIVLEVDVIVKYAGSLTGVYEPGYLDRLRDEWD